MATLALWCWVYGDNSSKIFEVNIPGTETIAALKEVIKNKKPVDFGHVDPDVLALYSIPIPDDDEQLEADLQQWKLSDASKPLPPRKPLSKLDLSGRVIIVRDPERCLNSLSLP
ncbi:hypothetical protein HD554DRAFT_2126404 [Boletus coccyginus]|nr:hypothetical protein HD554DRAFT_2126404 [Boletus coccyginus]